MKKELVYNAIQTPDGTILESNSRHDYNQHFDKNGKLYIIDGGLAYVRRSANGDEISLAIYSDESFDKVRQFAFRTGYGKPGNSDYGTFRITRFKDMTDNHLKGAIEYVRKNVSEENIHYQLLLKELEYRKENNIKINE